MRKILITLILIAVIGAYLIPGRVTNLIIATATPGGTYYPVGVAIGALISVKLNTSHNITATAITSAGSGENIHMLDTGEADLAILQALFGAMAYRGERFYEKNPVQSFRAVTVLWENVEHFVLLKKYGRTGNITDLVGLEKQFSIGKRGSGTEGSGRVILESLGVDCEEDIHPEYLGYNGSVQSMIDGRIAGANIPAGIPASAITQLFAQMGADRVVVLETTDEQIKVVRSAYPIWTRSMIPAGTYPGQDKDIATMAQPNFLACRQGLSEETVYQITRSIYENLSFLQNIHQATRMMAVEKALAGLPVPLHAGAAKYYREQGIIIPDRIQPTDSDINTIR